MQAEFTQSRRLLMTPRNLHWVASTTLTWKPQWLDIDMSVSAEALTWIIDATGRRSRSYEPVTDSLAADAAYTLVTA